MSEPQQVLQAIAEYLRGREIGCIVSQGYINAVVENASGRPRVVGVCFAAGTDYMVYGSNGKTLFKFSIADPESLDRLATVIKSTP